MQWSAAVDGFGLVAEEAVARERDGAARSS
jgi:hypothetical protein